jgi:hypothetical protein
VKARFNLFRDSGACIIVMRWPRRLESHFSEDQTLFLGTWTRNRSRSLRASFAGRRTSRPSQTKELALSRKKSFSCLAQRICELQPMNEKNGRLAHRRMVAGQGILRNHGRNNNSPATGSAADNEYHSLDQIGENRSCNQIGLWWLIAINNSEASQRIR